MSKIDYFDLISGADIYINDMFTLRQPSLSDIRELGYRKYNEYTNILIMSLDTFLEKADVPDDIVESTKSEVTLFDLLFSESRGRDILLNAFSFFTAEQIKCDVINRRFVFVDSKTQNITGYVDNSNFHLLKNYFLQINYAEVDESEDNNIKFRNKKERKKYERLMKKKKEFQKSKKIDGDINIPNMISAISAQHNSYNLTNIWSLTVYQLYDQFFRLNLKTQMDVIGLKWAAWGKEDFDFSVWYKGANSKK